MRRVLIVGATGELGGYLCAEYHRRGWYVIAVISTTTLARPIAADQLVEAQIADQPSLVGVMTGVDLVVSCLGIAHQPGNQDHWSVDHQTNLNVLCEAKRATVERFVHAHPLNALDQTQVLHALDLDDVRDKDEKAYGPHNPATVLLNTQVSKPSANLHHLNIERKNQ